MSLPALTYITWLIYSRPQWWRKWSLAVWIRVFSWRSHCSRSSCRDRRENDATVTRN